MVFLKLKKISFCSAKILVTIDSLSLSSAYVCSYATVFDEPAWDSKSVIANGTYYNLDALANISGLLVGARYEVLSDSTDSDRGLP